MASLLAVTAVIVNRALGSSDPCLDAQPLIQNLNADAFSATSFYDEGTQPSDARYYPGDGWSSETNVTNTDYLTVDLGSVWTICEVGTRATLYNESSTKYQFSYSLDGETFDDFRGEMPGPDRYSQFEVRNELTVQGSGHRGIQARYVRFTPKEWTWWPSMCVEAYGYGGISGGSTDPNTIWLGITAICGGVFVLIVVVLVCAYVRLKTDSATKYMRMHEMGMGSATETEAEDKKFINM